MRLSDAILAGCKISTPVLGVLTFEPDMACAIGSAYLGLGLEFIAASKANPLGIIYHIESSMDEINDKLAKEFPILIRSCGCTGVQSHPFTATVRGHAIYLNDIVGEAREEIAKWIRTREDLLEAEEIKIPSTEELLRLSPQEKLVLA